MKCQSCGKKEAAIKYKENINGNKQELYFCEECAKKLGFINFSSIFLPIFSNVPEYLFNEEEEPKCPNCGYTLKDFSNTGMFGCQICYETFSKELDSMFIKYHGKNRHLKLPDNNMKSKKNVCTLVELKEKLKEAIEKEEYENAAIIRDKIKGIEGKQ